MVQPMTPKTEQTRIQNENAAWSAYRPERQTISMLAELDNLLHFSLPKLPRFSRPKVEREVQAKPAVRRVSTKNA
jgi:hypothetical protein